MTECLARLRCKKEVCSAPSCAGLSILQILQKQTGLPPRFRAVLREDWRSDDAAASKVLQTYWAGIETRVQRGTGLYLYSPASGVGKTMAAAIAINEWLLKIAYHCNLDPQAIFFPVPEMLERRRRTFDNPDPELDELWDNATTVPLLVMDDIGAEKASDWVRERLYGLVNSRYNSEKATIYTSNLALDKLEDAVGTRTASRIRGSAIELLVTGSDRRGGP